MEERVGCVTPDVPTLPDGVLAGAVGNHVCGGGDASYGAHGDDVAAVLEHLGQKLKDGPKLR